MNWECKEIVLLCTLKTKRNVWFRVRKGSVAVLEKENWCPILKENMPTEVLGFLSWLFEK